MPHSFTSIATFTEVIARTLATYQIDTKPMFSELGLAPEPYLDPDSRIPIDSMHEIWEKAELLSGNPCIAFDVGMSFHATNFHAVGYAMLASSTLREAMERIVRYQRLLSTSADLDMASSEHIVEFLIRGDDTPQSGLDASVCAVVQVCRDVTHEDFAPISVHMERPEPVCARRLTTYFACPVHFGANETKLVFSAASLDERLLRNNPALVQASEEVARNYLAHMDKNDVVTKARVTLIGQLPDGEPNRGRVARALHMSERTLARRLAERDYTFTSLVDEIRNQLARDYLRQSRFSVTDVAFLLGFSDQSNFARAFKRWTSLSPTEFRLAPA